MRTWPVLLTLLGGALLLLSGCSGDDDTILTAALNGAQQAPPVVTTATGTGTIFLGEDRAQLSTAVSVIGAATAVTRVDIQYGAPGETGPVLFTVFDQARDGAFSGSVSRNLTSADFVAQPPGSPVGSFAEAVSALLAGNAYFNARTIANPNGEIRGNIVLSAS